MVHTFSCQSETGDPVTELGQRTRRKEENSIGGKVTSMGFQTGTNPMYESVPAEPRGQVWVGGGSVRLPGGESGRGGSGEWPTGGRAKKPGRLGGKCARGDLSRVTEPPLPGLSSPTDKR